MPTGKITCVGFGFQIARKSSNDPANVVDLIVSGDDSQDYVLQPKPFNKNPDAVRQVLRAIASTWPNVGWTFDQSRGVVTAAYSKNGDSDDE